MRGIVKNWIVFLKIHMLKPKPHVNISGDKTFRELTKVKWGH